MKSTLIDLTNMKFGLLTVISRAEDYVFQNGRHSVQWLCKCECGKNKIINGNSLKNGSTKSCGCIRTQKSTQRLVGHNKKYNTYDLSGDYGIGYSENGDIFYFDLEDYNKIKDGYWSYKSKEDHHVSGSINNKKTSLHRYIMSFYHNLTDNIVIDHINTHHPEDNRKSNLRTATKSQNQMNRKTAKNNTSGKTGVFWSNKDKRWVARIKINSQEITLGYFKNIEDAIAKRIDAENLYFKEYSYQNSINKNKETNK